MNTEQQETGKNSNPFTSNISSTSLFWATFFRLVVPNLVFVPFFIYGFMTGPFILALVVRWFLIGSVNKQFADEFCYVYWFNMNQKKEYEGKRGKSK